MTVNGVPCAASAEPRRTLVDFLRDDLGLTGTHAGCEQGACGACTVLLDGEPIYACLLFAVQADGRRVDTVEGLAPPGELGPLQEAFRECHALQCGFCTPGMLMAAHALLAEEPDPDERQIRTALAGNICRCTGYQSIVAAVRRAARR
jgi:carbon-monoxide dehydrogenase small subunit